MISSKDYKSFVADDMALAPGLLREKHFGTAEGYIVSIVISYHSS